MNEFSRQHSWRGLAVRAEAAAIYAGGIAWVDPKPVVPEGTVLTFPANETPAELFDNLPAGCVWEAKVVRGKDVL